MTTYIIFTSAQILAAIFFFYRAICSYNNLDTTEVPLVMTMHTIHFWGWLLLGSMLLTNVF